MYFIVKGVPVLGVYMYIITQCNLWKTKCTCRTPQIADEKNGQIIIPKTQTYSVHVPVHCSCHQEVTANDMYMYNVIFELLKDYCPIILYMFASKIQYIV